MDEEARKQAQEAQRAEEEKIKEQMRRAKRKKTIRRAAALITGAVVLSAAATETMLFVMFGRKGEASTAPFPLREWAAENGCVWREEAFLCGENTLRGYLIAGPNPKARMLIAHGMNACSDGFEPVVQYFVRRGYAVMIFDGTASGRSEGKRTVGLQQARLDVRAARQHFDGMPEWAHLPLVLLGHSAGAYGTALEAGNGGAAAAVCVSGFDSPLNTMRFWGRSYTAGLADVQYPFLWIRQVAALGAQADAPAARALIRGGTPALVVHGSADDTIPLNISIYRQAEESGADNVECLLVDDPAHSGHSNILFDEGEANEALLDQIEAFIAPHIGG